MKKQLALLLALGMSVSLLAGCGSSKTTESTQPTGTGSTDAAGDEPKKVVFMVNGSLGDKGFFDSCQEGIERLGSEYGCEVKTIEMGRDETRPGKTKDERGWRLSDLAASRSRSERVVSGTRCSRPFLISWAGIVSTSPSIQSRLSFVASPGRSIVTS